MPCKAPQDSEGAGDAAEPLPDDVGVPYLVVTRDSAAQKEELRDLVEQLFVRLIELLANFRRGEGRTGPNSVRQIALCFSVIAKDVEHTGGSRDTPDAKRGVDPRPKLVLSVELL